MVRGFGDAHRQISVAVEQRPYPHLVPQLLGYLIFSQVELAHTHRHGRSLGVHVSAGSAHGERSARNADHSGGFHTPGDPEAVVILSHTRTVAETIGHPAFRAGDGPTAAPQDARDAGSRAPRVRRAVDVGGCAIRIPTPLIHISRHVMESVAIRRETAHRRSIGLKARRVAGMKISLSRLLVIVGLRLTD